MRVGWTKTVARMGVMISAYNTRLLKPEVYKLRVLSPRANYNNRAKTWSVGTNKMAIILELAS
jgi:hypothetical protein